MPTVDGFRLFSTRTASRSHDRPETDGCTLTGCTEEPTTADFFLSFVCHV